MNIPKDPAILLSFVNTKLRDFYPSLDEMCSDLGADRVEIEKSLAAIGYAYNSGRNVFI